MLVDRIVIARIESRSTVQLFTHPIFEVAVEDVGFEVVCIGRFALFDGLRVGPRYCLCDFGFLVGEVTKGEGIGWAGSYASRLESCRETFRVVVAKRLRENRNECVGLCIRPGQPADAKREFAEWDLVCCLASDAAGMAADTPAEVDEESGPFGLEGGPVSDRFRWARAFGAARQCACKGSREDRLDGSRGRQGKSPSRAFA